jgi:hypothetical protein
MARFLSLLQSVDIGWPEIMLLRPLAYEDDDGTRHEVPAGFISDLASVPLGLRRIIPRAGRHNRAAVLHDWLYHMRSMRRLDMARAHADDIMLRAMRADKVPLPRRHLIRAALAVGSWWPWYFGKPDPRNIDL